MQHIFIINPTSGNKQATKYIPLIEEYFSDKQEAHTILLTEYPGHATELAQRYTKADDATVYILSGDGTANEVLNGLNEGVALAILPLGTGNDFIRMLEIPDMEIEQLIVETIEGKECWVDYGISNQRKFLNCSTMGFDADVGIFASKLKQKYPFIGEFSYVFAALVLLVKRKTMLMKLSFNDTKLEVDTLLIAVMNGRFYGGGFTPTPMASIQDGELDLCVINNTGLLRILTLLPRYKKGEHIHEDIVRFYKVKELHLKSAETINTQCDGEVYPENEIHFKLIERGLKIRVPKSSLLES